MDHRTTWVESDEGLRRALAAVGAGPLALDTEADSLHHYPEKVCLIQLSAGDRDWLLDPLAGLDLSPLGPPLADPSMRKILHGADYDLRVLHRDFGFEVRGLFDTMIAARLVGETAFGLSALLGQYFDVKLDKRFQRADWSLRPLPADMREYAVLDTRHLQALAGRLTEGLRALDRLDWAEQEFGRLEGVRWADASAGAESFRRVRGAGRLRPRGLAVLRELVQLRERTARRLDRPPFRIMRDQLLLELASDPPRDAAALSGLKGLPSAWRRPAGQRQILEAIEHALGLPDEALPEPSNSRRRRAEPAVEARLKELSRGRERLGAELGLEPSLIVSRAVLEELIRGGFDPDSSPPETMRPWQWRLVAPLLIEPSPGD